MTTRLAVLTDPHFNFLLPRGAWSFGLMCRDLPCDAIVITGDIAEMDSLRTSLGEFSGGFGHPVYFVLGNHDTYGGGIKASRRIAGQIKFATWLGRRRAPMIELADDTVLVGVDGWYDAFFGDPVDSTVEMSDWRYVRELRALERDDRQRVLRELGIESAKLARKRLNEALGKYRRVVLATHVPPFKAAATFRGKVSDDAHLPYYTNAALGYALLDVADQHPDKEILVLCGHSHGGADIAMRRNLRCITGPAEYGDPAVHMILDIKGGGYGHVVTRFKRVGGGHAVVTSP